VFDVAEEERNGSGWKLTFDDSPGALNHAVSLPEVHANLGSAHDAAGLLPPEAVPQVRHADDFDAR
jgi:hypothetical protein